MIAALLLAAAAPVVATPAVASPDGTLSVALGINGEDQPSWTLDAQGERLIAPSVLGLEFERYEKLANGLRVTGVERTTGEDRYDLIAGKVAHVAERYNQILVHYAEPGGTRRKLDLIVRAYDSGVALRYAIPAQAGLPRLRMVNELTQFAFPANYRCTGLNLGTFGTSHEGEFDPIEAALIRRHAAYELPLVCQSVRHAFAITEAAVERWPAAYLMGLETGELGVQTKLARRLDEPGIAVKADVRETVVTPWRVVSVARTPGKLIESTLLTSLNPPPQGDFSWVKPGKTSWDWWSGPVLADVPHPGSNDATAKAFIDLSARLHLGYAMIDEGWYVHSGGGGTVFPGADPTTTVPEIHLPELVDYAAKRDVGLILWVHWSLLDRDMDRVLDRIAGWGIKGIKVDFMDRDDQEMIAFYHRIAAATAKRHLLLDLHGATHPWGMTRTWPNFITQEGVMGAEYNKWTRRVTARHNVTLAYTRMLAGPMDYTPGGYRNRAPTDFRITAQAPQVQTTRAAALAMYVVFESPLQSVADTPDAYRDQPGLDFLAAVPASWDETRFVGGTLGESVAVARRKGTTWYVGALTDEHGRALSIPLDFLGAGRFRIRSWQDGAAATDLATATRIARRSDTLPLRLAPAGGAAAIIEPLAP